MMPLSQHANQNNSGPAIAADLEENIEQFHGFIIAARQRADYPLSRIYNMDGDTHAF